MSSLESASNDSGSSCMSANGMLRTRYPYEVSVPRTNEVDVVQVHWHLHFP